VFVVTPSCPVTTINIVLLPIFNGMLAEALPLETSVPLTVIVEFGNSTAGVTVTEDTLTLTLYDVVPLAKAGLNVPLLIIKSLNPTSDKIVVHFFAVALQLFSLLSYATYKALFLSKAKETT